MTKQINLPSGDWCLVDLPKGAKNIIVIKNQIRWKMNALKFWYDLKTPPPGNWKILGSGTADKLNSWDWKRIGLTWEEVEAHGFKPETTIILKAIV